MVKLHDNIIFNLQAGVFMEKLQNVFQMTVKEYEQHNNEVKWEKVKEKLVEFINENNPDRISEE
jgi:hypothetical protein